MTAPLPRLVLRPATEGDARLLFDFVNAPDALANKQHTDTPIEWEDHCAWLRERLSDPLCFLAMIEWRGTRVGQLRIQPKPGGHHVDIFVSPAARRAGIAQAALTAAMSRWDRRPLIAMVRKGNASSHALFRALGFRLCGSEGDFNRFQFGD